MALGPWAAAVALTVTLVLQALVFADGGSLALGANVWNMAILEPFAAYWVYRLLAGRRADSRRRAWAAAAGAYAGINLAALATAVELGLQPLLFRGPDGTPLYAPYPLAVAVPAMTYAHLLVAGPLEALVTGLALAYLARTGYVLHGDGAVASAAGPMGSRGSGAAKVSRGRSWWLVGAAFLAAPLGLLAGGTAWGEWGPAELQARLGYVPAGLARLADAWRGLLPDYAVPGLAQGSVLGYWIAASLGLALVVATVVILFRFAAAVQTGVFRWFRHG